MSGHLYSFDVFDTLITRRTATPSGIFALMQRTLTESKEHSDCPKRVAHNFFMLRMEAEKVARNTYVTEKVKDITLKQIYECFSLLGEASEEQSRRLMELEVDTELENVLPIPENIKKVQELTERGERVVLISNMYLESQDLRKLLLKASPVFRDIPLYVSGELGRTKGTHTLYHYVREQEQAEFSAWHHYGDDWRLDVEIPRSLGICAEHFEKAGLLEWERELLFGRERNPDLEVLLGVSGRVGGRETSFPYKVGFGYGAPVLLPYVLWVLEESARQGIERLYFIARDGYILKRMADLLIEGYGYPVRTAYLYGSRRAWRLPSVHPDRFDLQEFLRWNYPGEIYSYERIAEILGITMEELKLFLPFANRGKELAWPLVQEILQILCEEQRAAAAFIYGKQADKRRRVVSYLRQEIGEERSFAFVDLIGGGYTQKCLADLTEEFWKEPVKTFFYRLDYCGLYERNVNYVFFPNRIRMGNVIEVLCGAPHGQTVDYAEVDGAWSPVLEEGEAARLMAYGFEDYVRGIEAYVEEFVRSYSQSPFIFEDLGVLESYFDYMAQRRNRSLYDYIAQMPYGVTGHEKDMGAFAPRLSDKELRNIYFWHPGEPIKKYYNGYSLEYSLLLLSKGQKRKLAFYEAHSEDKIVKWLRRQMFRKGTQLCSHRYDLIADKIVLYGAGKRGQLLYRQLTLGKRYHSRIVLWVDREYGKCRQQGLQVYPPEDIRRTDYEQIVIGVMDEKLAGEIREFLMKEGVTASRILWIRPDGSIPDH